ncbi:MAG: metal ABC transporter substrate-binding protein [Christensenellales bacterium]|jgi:zinc transport system substrate-binding protein
MKIFAIALLTLSLMLASPLSVPAEEKLQIITMNFPAFDFARQVAGERAEVTLLLPPGVDAHSFEPSPRDVIAMQEADLLIYNGGIGENWISGMLKSMGTEAPAAIAMMDQVDTVQEELVEGMEDVPHAHSHGDEDDHDDHDDHEHEEHGDHGDHDHDHEERELDEHVWTTPNNAIKISRAILAKLSELDPAGRDSYQANFDRFEQELKALDQDFRALFAAAKRNTIVLGDRFPMRYFTNEYKLDYYAAFPGCAAETEPSARTIAFLMDTIRKEEIPVVFHIEFSNQKAANAIAAETGAKTLLLHSAHNVSSQEMADGITYLSIMRQNLNTLKEALY